MFVGCFDKSAPVSLVPSDIYNSKDGSVQYYEWMKDIRDSYAAHKFGPLRQCVTGVFLDPSGNVIEAGHTAQIYAGPKAEGKNDMLDIIKTAGRFSYAKVTTLKSQLEGYAKTLSASELAALKPAAVHPVAPHEVRLSRKKFSRSKP